MATPPCTIVAVTPMPLDRDSRTLKQARTLAVAGYRSIVVAAGSSIEVAAEGELPTARATILGAPSATERRMGGFRSSNVPWIVHAGLFVGWLCLYAFRTFFRPLCS